MRVLVPDSLELQLVVMSWNFKLKFKKMEQLSKRLFSKLLDVAQQLHLHPMPPSYWKAWTSRMPWTSKIQILLLTWNYLQSSYIVPCLLKMLSKQLELMKTLRSLNLERVKLKNQTMRMKIRCFNHLKRLKTWYNYRWKDELII